MNGANTSTDMGSRAAVRGALLGIAVGLVLLGACGQKDPVGVDAKGSIAVTSDEPGATILLDGAETTSVTPDTLEDVAIGDHEVAVRKEGFTVEPASRTVNVRFREMTSVSFALTPATAGQERVVLLEDFSNTGCIPCVESDSIVTEVLQSYGSTKVVGIQIHVYWPFPGDPFYLAAVGDNNSRTSYYGVDQVGVPFIMIDGVSQPSATSGASVTQAVEDRLGVPAVVRIDVRNEVLGSSGTAEVTVVGLPGVGGFGDLRLRCVLIEGEVQHDAPNGLSVFRNVMRRLLPSADGEAIAPSEGDSLTFSYPYTVDSDWQTGQLSVVAFVQDEGTKEILQAATSRRETR
jgi:hypothetical protein